MLYYLSFYIVWHICLVGVRKKTEKPIKLRKPNREKKPIKPIKILKKLTSSVRFWFYKPETEKTKSNLNRKKPEKKPSQTRKTELNRKNRAKPEKTKPKPSPIETNRFELVFILKNWTEPGQFEPLSVRLRFFFKTNSVWLLFLIKTEPNRK